MYGNAHSVPGSRPSGTQGLPQYDDQGYPLVQDPHLKTKGSSASFGRARKQFNPKDNPDPNAVRITTNIDVHAEPRDDMV